MARLARVTIPNLPHHITQRGNRRQQTFFCDADYELYLDLLAEWCLFYGVEIWAYCLMPNHTHVIAVPKTEVALGRAMAETHRRYTRHINFEKKWKGHLWQSRFASFPMDEAYLAGTYASSSSGDSYRITCLSFSYLFQKMKESTMARLARVTIPNLPHHIGYSEVSLEIKLRFWF